MVCTTISAVASDLEFGQDDLASGQLEQIRWPQLTLEFRLLGILITLKGETLCAVVSRKSTNSAGH